MKFWRTIRAWVGTARPGRCKWCHHAIMWVITEQGTYVPFDLGFTVREVVTHPATGGRFLVLDKADRHACIERRQGKGLTRDRTERKSA